ncbi:hypothetical protein [Ferruginibacter sp.]
MRRIVGCFSLLFSTALAAQTMDTVVNKKNGVLESYYFTLLPKQPSKGLLVVLGGFSTPSETLIETNLPKKACDAGYTVVLPFLYRADLVDSTNIFQSRLEALIPEVITKYHIPKDKFILGGQSWAGHQAMLYAERAFTPGYHSVIKPDLVFAVDPPLDLKRLYNGYVRTISLDPAAKNAEAQMITTLFKNTFVGSPEQQPAAYEKASSFYRDAANGGNAKYLTGIPVRLYSDPDINWFITQRNSPVEWTNLADISACIVQLRLLGNKNAEYISCLGKGFLPDGKRHPHAFSMLDADEFVAWANKMLYP